MTLTLADFDYEFPSSLIATQPLADRSASRMMVVDPSTGTWAHESFANLGDFLREGDTLVLNNSKVFPARLKTRRSSGGKQEILLLHQQDENKNGSEVWEVLLNHNRQVKKGDVFEWPDLSVTLLNDAGESPRLARIETKGKPLFESLDQLAEMPLPPYMNRSETSSDRERYQTVYAQKTGSVAAPTAGLHFTPEILEGIQKRGVTLVYVTLHVGIGTFLPVRTQTVADHEMHEEFYQIDDEACEALNRAYSNKGRVIAIGTTSCRVLESLRDHQILTPHQGSTDLFVYPPYQFRRVTGLLTNFHQPESTLLMLVSALVGREFLLETYREAIQEQYRLFSYGDCQFILPGTLQGR